MKRDIENHLIDWKIQNNRSPLLLRGARQVGKTYLIENFGKKYFDKFITVNFEYQPGFKKCFESLNPRDILNRLEIFLKTEIIPGKTLLFLDEIQEHPPAILAMRYFKEKLPDLHVVGAGSLLEFVLNSPDFRMPVGRISFLHLYPFSFGEFLEGSGNYRLREYFSKASLKTGIDSICHEQGLKLVKQYCFSGGMPAALNSFFETQSMLKTQNILSAILESYKNDFGKYAQRTNYTLLREIFDAVPGLVGQRFRYTKISHEIRSREIKQSLNLLNQAGLVALTHAASGTGLPLGALIHERTFKLFFLDVGLLQRACGLDNETFFRDNLQQINAGSITEQFVFQQLISQGTPYHKNEVFFWVRDKIKSEAEVDFLYAAASRIFPLEVKSGSTGTLKSLRVFLEEKKAPCGIRVSSHPLSFHDRILSVPFYMLEHLPELIKEIV